ncbi:MAG: hypothetical protein LUC89_02160, partial [Oscillospiraceae bacterium]|nr:hypothetical protein [Oscillospiraceae bacterium]
MTKTGRTAKRLFALLLVLLMVMGLVPQTYAVGTTYTITYIDVSSGSTVQGTLTATEGQTYAEAGVSTLQEGYFWRLYSSSQELDLDTVVTADVTIVSQAKTVLTITYVTELGASGTLTAYEGQTYGEILAAVTPAGNYHWCSYQYQSTALDLDAEVVNGAVVVARSCTETISIENEVAATCGADGSKDIVTTCSVCGAELSRETVIVPATGSHDYVATQTVAPTCTEQGYTIYTCTVCGDSYVA